MTKTARAGFSTRGWVVIYCLAALAGVVFLILADAAISIEGVDDARVDAEQLQ